MNKIMLKFFSCCFCCNCRNEVWRYDPQFGILHPRKVLIKAGTTGMKYGLILAIGTILLKTVYQKLTGKENQGHGHGHH